MSSVIKVFNIGIKQVLRDGMLLIMIPAPFLMGAALRLLLPFADNILQQRLGYTLLPWYSLSDGMLLSVTPVMTAMICAFVILDERDVGLSTYYHITPAGGYSYLIARIALPMVWGFVSSVMVVSVFGFVISDLVTILIISGIGTLQGVVVSMFLVTIAGNKVEGLALAKLTNIFIMGFILPFFMHSDVKYIFGVLPSFWIGEILINANIQIVYKLIIGIAGFASCLLWMMILTKVFVKRIN